MLTAENRRQVSAERSQQQLGSAYILTLLVLVVLTILGLSISLITQTEMQVGATERVIQRVFYAADSGLDVATSRALVDGDYASTTFSLDDPDSPAGLNLRHEIDVSPFFPIQDSPCNLCEINNAGTYSEHSFRRINHAVTSEASRLGGAGDAPLARKAASAMIEVQPWREGTEAYAPLNDPAEVAKIKF